MSDPDAAQHEPPPPPQPPRPVAQANPVGRSQLEADEAYARRLAQHYQNQDYSRSGPPLQGQQQRQYVQPRQGASANQQGYYQDDRERSFIDDDLPVIRDNIKKGFLETQSKINTFFTNFKKQIDGDDDDETPPPPPPRRPTQQSGGGTNYSRQSGDHTRYDADPQVLGDDFTALQLRDDTGKTLIILLRSPYFLANQNSKVSPKPTPGRPAANPNLFKPTPATPQSQSGRRVSFQEGPPEDINESLYRASPEPPKQASTPNSKNSKWQPLQSVDPDPVAERDPFSLGDSDDDESKKKNDPKPEDAERLQRATAEAMADDLSSPADKK